MGFEVLTKEEAAARVKISPRFLHQQILAGNGPATFRIGRRVLIRSDALQGWLEQRSAAAPKLAA